MRKILLCFLLTTIVLSGASRLFAQTTEFTYQGHLNESNAPANGNFDFEFGLFSALTNGIQLGSTLTRNGVAISGGVFSVKLDFGTQFTGANRYLEIRVRQSGGGVFLPLAPRQLVNSTPYSIKSINADNATNATNATNAANATTAATATNALQLGGIAASNFLQVNGNGAGLINLNASNVTSGTLHNGRMPSPMEIGGSVGLGSGVIAGRNFADDGTGIYGEARGTVGRTFGVRGTYFGTNTGGAGVYGDVTSANSAGAGVEGNSANGSGVLGVSENGSGIRGIGTTGYGVFGSSSTGFAGFFNGKSYFSNRVGIGSPNPSAGLDVFATAANHTLVGGGNTTGSEIKLTSDLTAHFSVYNAGNGNLTFANTSTTTATNNPGSPLMSITSTGNIGIGTTAPGFRLHVNGETRTDTLSIGNFVANNGGPALCANTLNNRVALCTSSSLRYKGNIRNFERGLDLVRRLRPIRFTWRDGGAEGIGLAAEEVAAVAPELAFTQAGKVEGVNYDRIGVVLINAVKEQQAQIEKHRALIENQRNTIKLLTKAVCMLDQGADVCRDQEIMK